MCFAYPRMWGENSSEFSSAKNRNRVLEQLEFHGFLWFHKHFLRFSGFPKVFLSPFWNVFGRF